MFVLIGEMEGDYGDFYQRYRDVLRISQDEELLKKFVDGAPKIGRERDDEEFFYVDGEAYIALDINEVDEMTSLESNAYDIGYVAYLLEKQFGHHDPSNDAPGTAERTMWERGWNDAVRDNKS